jgi:serine/threonine-protein kinase RsbW
VTTQTVTVKVPPTAGHLAVLRTCVGGVAARDRFTLDQVDDLRMAVEEAGVQLLRRASGDSIEMALEPTESGLEIRLTAEVDQEGPVIDETSFSWAILKALADDIRVEAHGTRAIVVLAKHRLATVEDLG